MARTVRELNPITEKRSQLRIEVAVGFSVVTSTNGRTVPAKLRNISWGGAEFEIAESPGAVGDSIEIILPWAKGKVISIISDILRIEEQDNKSFVVAIRFASISPKEENRFERLLRMLLFGSDQDHKGEQLLLARRLEIAFDDSSEMRAMLEEIAHGSLLVTVTQAFDLNQSVQLLISGISTVPVISLRCRVAHQAAVKNGSTELFQLGLVFEHPENELKKRIRQMLKNLRGKTTQAAKEQSLGEQELGTGNSLVEDEKDSKTPLVLGPENPPHFSFAS